jgi:hypothetical protein
MTLSSSYIDSKPPLPLVPISSYLCKQPPFKYPIRVSLYISPRPRAVLALVVAGCLRRTESDRQTGGIRCRLTGKVAVEGNRQDGRLFKSTSIDRK